MQRTNTMLTVGHGTLSADALGSLLREHDAGGRGCAAVPREPPPPAREPVQLGRLAAGARRRLPVGRAPGGRRHGSAPSSNTSVRNASFRAYADHMAQASWQQALSRLIADASRRRIAVMCSEALWWRCHRRFIADAAVLLHDMPVEHLMHDGRRHAHPPMPEARVVDGQLQYDR